VLVQSNLLFNYKKSKVMKYKESLGIDVSKNTFDAYLFTQKLSAKFENNSAGFKKLFQWVKKSKVNFNELIICFEHTGIYSIALALFFESKDQYYTIVPGIEIKRSIGMVRGKNDKVDAFRIAEYAFLRREVIKPYKLPSKNILKLQKLISLRLKLVKHRASYKSNIKDLKNIISVAKNATLFGTQEKMISYTSKQIDRIESEIKELIKSDNSLNQIYNLIISVKGVGLVLAVNFIVTTNCFSSFSDSRKYACYCGIAPFSYQSGSSIHSASKISHYANKKMKALLNVAAWSAIQHDKELKEYFSKRIQKGKSKMSTVNIIRNKIVHRVFAVVKRGTPFVELNKHAA